jgi:KaiC/GvpD/RAD55 family RecA-like ATPase
VSLELMAQDTYRRGANGGTVMGWPSLERHIGSDAAREAREILAPVETFGDLFGDRGEKSQKSDFIEEKNTSTPPQKRLHAADRALRIGGQQAMRLPTGFPTIDAATRGGILLRKVGVIGGAPGAGKTAMLVKLAYTWLSQGIAVGILASDEDADALLIRFGQLVGVRREALEDGDCYAREKLADWCKRVPLLLADGDEDDATLEGVSRELRALAGTGPSVLLIDSMQTVRPEKPLPKGADIRTRVNEVVRGLKRAAKADGHLVLATSEISKAGYRNRAQAENINALSAFKESGDIEYGVSLALVLVSCPGSSELVNATIVKNRLGPQKSEFIVKLNHDRADVVETTSTDLGAADPKFQVKQQIRAVLDGHRMTGLTRSDVARKVGGTRQLVFDALKEMVEANELTDTETKTVRFPLPGEKGYKS